MLGLHVWRGVSHAGICDMNLPCKSHAVGSWCLPIANGEIPPLRGSRILNGASSEGLLGVCLATKYFMSISSFYLKSRGQSIKPRQNFLFR
jgi:hypothetical protein